MSEGGGQRQREKERERKEKGWREIPKRDNDDDDDHFYTALFSALEQTHCTRM